MAAASIARHSGRFGARYGVSVRKRFEMVEQKQRVPHICPKCGFEKVTRVSTGIFVCKKCSAKYAGGAFYPQTLSGSIISKMVAQKAFSAQASTKLLAEVKGVDETAVPIEADAAPLTDEEKIDRLMAEPKPKKKRGRAKQEEVKLKMGFQDTEGEAEEADETDDEALSAEINEDSDEKPGREAA